MKFVTRRARVLRKNLTDAEQLLWRELRYKQVYGFKFRRQVPVQQYIVDFLCMEAMLIIEVDGGQHTVREKYDNARTEYLETNGYRLLRFWNNEVIENLQGVKQIIADALLCRATSAKD